MPWFYLSPPTNTKEEKQLFYYAKSIDKAYLEQFEHHNWQCKITPASLPHLNLKELDYFLLELLKGLDSGLKLHQVLDYMYQGVHTNRIKCVAAALDAELMRGMEFNQTFKRLVHHSLHSYCDLFVKNTTPEQLQINLKSMHEQIHNLRNWTIRLGKSLIYPCFIMQISLLMWLTNSLLNNDTTQPLFYDVAFYCLISLLQALLYSWLQSNVAIKLIENSFPSFRLNKLFCLINASIKVGNTLQTTLTQLPNNFSNAKIRQDLLMVYYELRLGRDYLTSFPDYWFPKESLLALTASCHTGDIHRALLNAAQLHEKNWQRQLTIIEKICPIITLIIAGAFVSQTLIAIYEPLLTLS